MILQNIEHVRGRDMIEQPEFKTDREILLLLVRESNLMGEELKEVRETVNTREVRERRCPLSEGSAGVELVKRVDRTWLVALAALIISLANLSPSVITNLGPLLKLLIH